MSNNAINLATTQYQYDGDFINKEDSKNILSTNDGMELTCIAANNNIPAIPTKIDELIPYITTGQKAIDAINVFIKQPNLLKHQRDKLLKEGQEYGERLMMAELLIAEFLRYYDKKSAPWDGRPKHKIIKELGLTPKKARLISYLTFEAINQAKEKAIRDGEIINRSKVLSFTKRNDFNNNNGKFTGLTKFYADKHLNFKDNYPPIKYTVLFANAGIEEFYLKKHGFIGAVANELLPERANFYKSIYPDCEMVVGDINDNIDKIVNLHIENGCEMLMASPPCQTFSKAGSRDFTNPKTNLFIPTLKIIARTMPKNIIIENVPEFFTAKPVGLKEILDDMTIGDYIVKQLQDLGYIVNTDVQNGADYGTAQSRKRAIILASKKELGMWLFPKKDDFRPMLWQAIGDLPSIEAGEQGKDINGNDIKWHKAFDMAAHDIYTLQHTATGQSAHKNKKEFRPKNADGTPANLTMESSYKRKDWSKPCNTITTASISLAGHQNIHPGRPKSDDTYSDARFLTILELLRVTGLPDNYPIPKWAENDKKLICDVLGECFLPKHVERLMTTLPR